ncbi:pseudouridine synthase [Pseudoalteromonas sp. T1lg65]|uniref:pseudouridine synthase n=1 Tax=Pseudoalteromonas sp. T1lg65 TaxID=2077101 RepID=UPI003F7A3B22
MTYPMRLAKYIGHCGVCSRKQASRLIEQGDVSVNGRPANHVDHVTPDDLVVVNGVQLTGPAIRELFAYHKPVGIDCKINPDDPSSIYHQLPTNTRVYPIGRLDKDSRGLLLLTNDGALCNRLIHPDFHQEKEYWVRVDKPLSKEFCQRMAAGVPILDTITLPCKVELRSEYSFQIVLKQGLNRQIRRMAQHFGYKVQDLYRVRIAQLCLSNLQLPEGQKMALPADYFDSL